METELCKLARKYHSDKCPAIYHGYTPFYDELLRKRNIKRVLEIGIGYVNGVGNPDGSAYIPGASLFMWEEYFPEAEIYGLDIDPRVLINGGRIKSFVCDQGNSGSLIDAATNISGEFDLIVDDGSHIPEHQRLTAGMFLPRLSATGIYIVEDATDTSFIATLPFRCEIKEFEHLPTNDNRLIVIQH